MHISTLGRYRTPRATLGGSLGGEPLKLQPGVDVTRLVTGATTRAAVSAAIASDASSNLAVQPDLSDKCRCLVDVTSQLLASHGTVPGPDALAQAGINCSQDPVAFARTLEQAGADVSSCVGAWWKKPSTWLIAGGVLAAAGAAYYGMSR